MQSPLPSASAATDPKSVKVSIATGTGVNIDWNDGHNTGIYSFDHLRKICACDQCKAVKPLAS